MFRGMLATLDDSRRNAGRAKPEARSIRFAALFHGRQKRAKGSRRDQRSEASALRGSSTLAQHFLSHPGEGYEHLCGFFFVQQFLMKSISKGSRSQAGFGCLRKDACFRCPQGRWRTRVVAHPCAPSRPFGAYRFGPARFRLLQRRFLLLRPQLVEKNGTRRDFFRGAITRAGWMASANCRRGCEGFGRATAPELSPRQSKGATAGAARESPCSLDEANAIQGSPAVHSGAPAGDYILNGLTSLLLARRLLALGS